MSNIHKSNNNLQQKFQLSFQQQQPYQQISLFPLQQYQQADRLFPTDASNSSQDLMQDYPPTYNFFQNHIQQSDLNLGDLKDEDQQDNLLLEDAESEIDLKNKEMRNQFLQLDSKVLYEEDEIIIQHRNHIDEMVDICKSDMCLLTNLDQNHLNSKDYFQQLKENLQIKQLKIQEFINKLKFYDELLEQRLQIECEIQNAQKYNQMNENFNQLIKQIQLEAQENQNNIKNYFTNNNQSKLKYQQQDYIIMTDQTPNDFHSQLESSPLDLHQSNVILFQPQSPILFRAHCSPNNMVLQDYFIAQPLHNLDDIFPFDQQPIQKMFDQQTSNNQSPQLKQVVIKQSQNKQQGFQIVQINTTQMTPQKRRSEQTRRYYSEKNEKKSINLAFYQDQTPQRSQKGLRNLSVKVRDIVLELKSTSYNCLIRILFQITNKIFKFVIFLKYNYFQQKHVRYVKNDIKLNVVNQKFQWKQLYKDVAQRLIQDLGSDGQIVELDNPKDEQNIKRRVYDALNVMIASKVLRKDGKRVISDVYCKHRMRRNETDMFKEQLQGQKNAIKEKKKRLQELFIKVVALKNLVQRNQNNQSDNKMMFPILAFQAQQSQIKLKMESKILKILSQQKLKLSADLDILVQLKMYKLYKNMEEFMPKNLLEIVQINDLCS